MVGIAQLGERRPKVQWTFAALRTTGQEVRAGFWKIAIVSPWMARQNMIMVGIAQLVEPWIVIPVVVGSSPITHPIFSFRAFTV